MYVYFLGGNNIHIFFSQIFIFFSHPGNIHFSHTCHSTKFLFFRCMYAFLIPFPLDNCVWWLSLVTVWWSCLMCLRCLMIVFDDCVWCIWCVWCVWCVWGVWWWCLMYLMCLRIWWLCLMMVFDVFDVFDDGVWCIWCVWGFDDCVWWWCLMYLMCLRCLLMIVLRLRCLMIVFYDGVWCIWCVWGVCWWLLRLRCLMIVFDDCVWCVWGTVMGIEKNYSHDFALTFYSESFLKRIRIWSLLIIFISPKKCYELSLSNQEIIWNLRNAKWKKIK